MSRDQQAARVNVRDDEWIEFRTLGMRKRRNIADYLGELVQRELTRSQKPKEPRPATEKQDGPRQPAPRVRLDEQELLAMLPRPRQSPHHGKSDVATIA